LMDALDVLPIDQGTGQLQVVGETSSCANLAGNRTCAAAKPFPFGSGLLRPGWQLEPHQRGHQESFAEVSRISSRSSAVRPTSVKRMSIRRLAARSASVRWLSVAGLVCP